MCIRDRSCAAGIYTSTTSPAWLASTRCAGCTTGLPMMTTCTCLLYTSPSPRDGHLSIRRQRQDVYKRQELCGRDLHVHYVSGLARLDEMCGLYYGAADDDHLYLSLIHISEPTRRTPLYSSAASRCV